MDKEKKTWIYPFLWSLSLQIPKRDGKLSTGSSRFLDLDERRRARIDEPYDVVQPGLRQLEARSRYALSNRRTPGF